MRRGKHDNAAGGLRHGLIQTLGQPRHHDAAEKALEIRLGRSPGRLDDLPDRHPDRNPQRHRCAHRARHGQILVRDRLVQTDVYQRFHVRHHAADIARKPARRDHAARDVVDQHEFIACRVAVPERLDAHARGQCRSQFGDDVGVLFLDADDALPGAHLLHRQAQALEHGLGQMVQQLLVLVQQRLALGGVDDEQRNLGLELDRGGEAPAAGADDAQFLYPLGESAGLWLKLIVLSS